MAGTKRAAETDRPSDKKARLDLSTCDESDKQSLQDDRDSLAEEPLFSEDEDDDATDASSPGADGEEEKYASKAPSKARAENKKLITARKSDKKPDKKHWRPKTYTCDREGCDKAFRRPTQLTAHLRTHDNKRVHACPHEGCDKTFLRSEHMTRHYEQWHAERTNICDFKLVKNGQEVNCGAAFSTKQRLQRHRVAHTEKKKWAKIPCPTSGCDRIFRKQETLDKHIKIDHLREEKPYTCNYSVTTPGGTLAPCPAAFKSQNGLKRHHMYDHNGTRFLCQPCAAKDDSKTPEEEGAGTLGFATFGELDDHMKKFHGPNCEVCGKMFESSTVLKAHVDVEHIPVADRRKFHCPHEGCGSSFTRNNNLTAHVKSAHGTPKAWVCGEADMSKSKKVAVWDGQGCGHTVNTKHSLEEHIRTKHLGLMGSQQVRKVKKEEDTAIGLLTGTGPYTQRPYGCLVEGCQHRFVNRYQLGTHLEMTHGWQVDDINDKIEQRQAVVDQNERNDQVAEDRAIANDDFYFGGLDEFHGMRTRLEADLAQQSTGLQAGVQASGGMSGNPVDLFDGTCMAMGGDFYQGLPDPSLDPTLIYAPM